MLHPRRHHRQAAASALFALLAGALAPSALATGVSDIGYVDQAALAAMPAFTRANEQLQAYRAQLDRQFARQMRGVRDQTKAARIAQADQAKFAQRQRNLLAPLFQRAQVAIASVSSSRALSVVVDKRIVVFGGQDITGAVENLLSGPGDPVPPVNTPPPSSVGYVDQAQIDALPKMKAANDAFGKFQAAQQSQAQSQMRKAKTDAQRQAILKSYQDALGNEQKSTIAPLVDQTRNAIADVAKKKGLLLVIDRSNLIYGGTDITGDVTNELK